MRLVDLRQERIQVQRKADHRKSAVRFAGPQLLRAVTVKLDPIFIRVSKVQRLAHAVVRSSVKSDSVVENRP